MLNLLKDFLGYFKYHLFEVEVEPQLRFEYKLWIIKRFFRVLFLGRSNSKSYLFPKDVIVSNQFGNFFVPKNSDMILTLSSKSESDLLVFFKVKDNSIFLDIGGNAGKYSAYIAKHFNPKKVYTFEPSPSTFEILQKNVSLNSFSKINIYNVGLSDTEGKIKFANGKLNSGLSHIIVDADESGIQDFDTIEVNIISLNQFILSENINPSEVDLIKIDVEGHEYSVLKGSTELLKALPAGARILIEILPDAVKVAEIIRFIESYNFSVVQLNIEYFLFTRK